MYYWTTQIYILFSIKICIANFKALNMVPIKDGNLENIAQAWRKNFFSKKKIRFVTGFDLIKFFKQIK